MKNLSISRVDPADLRPTSSSQTEPQVPNQEVKEHLEMQPPKWRHNGMLESHQDRGIQHVAQLQEKNMRILWNSDIAMDI